MGIEVFVFIPMKFVMAVEPPADAANVGGLMLWLLLLIGLRKALATVPSTLFCCEGDGMFFTSLLLLPPLAELFGVSPAYLDQRNNLDHPKKPAWYYYY